MITSLLDFSWWRKRWPALTADEVRRHNHSKSLWIVAGSSVYDVTHMLHVHPGGERALLRSGGGARDCLQDFRFHSRQAQLEWGRYKIGELTQNETATLFATTVVAQQVPRPRSRHRSVSVRVRITHACQRSSSVDTTIRLATPSPPPASLS